MKTIDAAKGLINRGNWNRIREVMRKAKNKKPVKTLFFGGSITQGCLSSTPDTCYSALVYQWWKERFPETEVSYVNCGIGGTTSQFGVARVLDQALSEKPDFMLVEFAVNDEANDLFMETYEGLVRRILKAQKGPSLMLMNNVRFDTGENAEEIHLPVAQAYGVPMVSMKSAIWPEIQAGNIEASAISQDMLHPNDEGHRLIADVIISLLEQIYNSLDIVEEGDKTLPLPITKNRYENAFRINRNNMAEYGVLLEGFEVDKRKKREYLDIFSEGFTATKVGDSITFKVRGTEIAIQYRKTISLPAPVAKAVIDNDEEHAVILDANFDETWGDCLYIETIARGLDYKEHEVKITVTESHEDDKLPFYLVSLISSFGGSVLLFAPVFKHNIWGGNRLGSEWGYELPGSNIGECWGVAALKSGDCVVKNGFYRGCTLSELWEKYPEMFQNRNSSGEKIEDRFPLMVKIIDAQDDLSIQVHPDDEYAAVHENGSLGKTECWYILDAPEDAELIIGHNASTKEELVQMINDKRWDSLIRRIRVKKGDFIKIEPGTVHAVTAGLQILETQQNSDITYRVYDYDRIFQGSLRELHIQKSIDVISVPSFINEDSVLDTREFPVNNLNEMVSCKAFKVWKLQVFDKFDFDTASPYIIASVVAGHGTVMGTKIAKGDHMIIPASVGRIEMRGFMTIILSSVK